MLNVKVPCFLKGIPKLYGNGNSGQLILDTLIKNSLTETRITSK